MPTETVHLDCDPETHYFLDALVTSSFKLACGHNLRMSAPKDAILAMEVKRAGMTIYCGRCEQDIIITRSTHRLVGWQDPPTGRWRPSR